MTGRKRGHYCVAETDTQTSWKLHRQSQRHPDSQETDRPAGRTLRCRTQWPLHCRWNCPIGFRSRMATLGWLGSGTGKWRPRMELGGGRLSSDAAPEEKETRPPQRQCCGGRVSGRRNDAAVPAPRSQHRRPIYTEWKRNPVTQGSAWRGWGLTVGQGLDLVRGNEILLGDRVDGECQAVFDACYGL